MSEWTEGYRSAIGDLEKLVETRFSQSFPTRFRKAVAGRTVTCRTEPSGFGVIAVKSDLVGGLPR